MIHKTLIILYVLVCHHTLSNAIQIIEINPTKIEPSEKHTIKKQSTDKKSTVQKLSGATVSKDDLMTFIEQSMQNHQITGLSLALINDGEVVLQHASGLADKAENTPVTITSIFEAASLSKPLFGFFVMQFVQAGQLDLDQPLYQYLPHPDLQHDSRYHKITARMVLSHTTGLPNWRTDEPDKGLHIAFEPDSAWRYSGEGYQYLAKVLAHIAHTDADGLQDMFQKQLAVPLGMQDTQFIADDGLLTRKVLAYNKGQVIDYEVNPHEFGAAYSVHTTAKDYARWLQAIMRSELLTRESINTYLSGQNVNIDANDPQKAMGLSDWALGFSIYDLPSGKVYVHGGNNPGFSCMVVISTEQQWGVVIFTNANQASDFLLSVAQWLL